jgi:hypothetical protein
MITSPCHPGNAVCDTAFSAYAYRQQQIEDFINALASTSNPNDYGNQSTAALVTNLNIDSLTFDEAQYIKSEVAKRWAPQGVLISI